MMLLITAIETVDSIVIKRPSSKSAATKYRNNNNNDKNKKKKKNQNLCLDKAYHSKDIEQEITKRGYIPHIRHRREERRRKETQPETSRKKMGSRERTNS